MAKTCTLDVDGDEKNNPQMSDLLSALEKQNEFFIVSRSDSSYLQGTRNSGKLTLEYQFGDDVKNHMEIDQEVADADAMTMLLQYTKGDDTWKQEYKWKGQTFIEPPAQKKQRC
mmetsp:Transcript_16/g.32  ORF Transcript_16/g.32 Transcript_16/m.32 type:complete len:114 (+) Transcript_16:124-465(+)